MLGDEHRLAAMTQLLAFSRRQGETINGAVARYEVVRQRAAREGHLVMSWERLCPPTLAGMQAGELDPTLVPDDGHHPEYEADLDPVHINPLITGRGLWKERSLPYRAPR